MRAGPYAEWSGRTWRLVSVDKPFVRLLEGGDQPKPEGFELDRSGRWTQGVVPVDELSDVLEVVHEIPL